MNRVRGAYLHSELHGHPEQQLDAWHKDRQRWRHQHPVTAALAEPLEIVPVSSPRVPTATTDGRKVLFNPAWSTMLDDARRDFLQAHLVWHAAAGDYRGVACTDKRRWHLACDHAVNTQLLHLAFPLPEDTVLFPAAVAWPVLKVYAWLANHHWLEAEKSPDTLCWQIDLPSSPELLTTLDSDWRRHIHTVVASYLGTPWLPDHVAAWLLTRR